MVQKVVNGDFGSRYARFLVSDPGASSRDSYKEFHSSESSTSSARPRLIVTYGSATAPSGTTTTPSGSGDIVLTSNSVVRRAGKWIVESNSGAIGGSVIRHPNANLGKISTAYLTPTHYFEMTFTAEAGKPYRLWLRGRADNNYWANDSVHVQFSGSVTKSGSATYRIGTSSSTSVNLEECDNCGVSGWMWADNGWGGRDLLGPQIYFAKSGTQTMRVQTREDGLAIDRIVLSPSTYLTTEPTAGTSTSAPTPQPAPAPEPEPTPPTSTSTLKVLHWNIHHGVGTDGRYDIPRFVSWMAKWRPDVISINEAEKYTGWGNEDQPRRFRDLLQSATGQTWYYHFAQEYGDWSSNGKGNLILSRFPFVSTGREILSWERTIAIATVVVNGRNITVMSTHLDPSSHSRREAQAKQVNSIASSWSNPRIIAGDFNAWPDQSSIAVMTSKNYDSWAEAVKLGTASSFSGNSPFGATKKGRIDYIFHSHGSTTVLKLKSVSVPDTRNSSGVMPSDHRPVLTIYEVR
jgi:endonuclease/exonuclease/phosphatase family metal-dependent hydrolase